MSVAGHGFGAAEKLTSDSFFAVASGMEKMKNSMFRYDAMTMVDLMPPSYFKFLGVSPDKIVKATQDGMQNLKTLGYVFKQLQYHTPEHKYRCQELDVVLITTTMTVDTPDGEVVNTGYVVASRLLGKQRWYFVDGSGIADKQVFDRIFHCDDSAFPIPKVSSHKKNPG